MSSRQRGGREPRVRSERDRSPRRGMCAAVLTLQAITLALSTPVLIALADLAVPTALGIGLGLAVVCLLVAGMLRAPWTYAAGWVIQVAATALGVLTPVMWILGPVFALLWGSADLLGRRIERERAAAFAAFDAERGSGASPTAG